MKSNAFTWVALMQAAGNEKPEIALPDVTQLKPPSYGLAAHHQVQVVVPLVVIIQADEPPLKA